MTITSLLRWSLFVSVTTIACHGADITIALDQTIAPAVPPRLGINLNYLTDHDAQRPSGSQSLSEALGQLGAGCLRYPGGEKAELTLWSVPPYTAPTPQLARTGPHEWPASDKRLFAHHDGSWHADRPPLDTDAAWLLAQSNKADLVLVLPFDSAYKAPGQDGTAPSVEQLLTNAVTWVRHCREHDIRVALWEIGNETDYDDSYAGHDPGHATFVRDATAIATAIKQEDPSARIGINVHKPARMDAVLSDPKLLPLIDTLVIHTYPVWDWNQGFASWPTTGANFTGEWRKANQALKRNCTPEQRARISIALTETNAIDYAGGWEDRNDLGHALAVFEIIGQHLRFANVERVIPWNTRWIEPAPVAPLGRKDLLAKLANNPNAWNKAPHACVATKTGLRLQGEEATTVSHDLTASVKPGVYTLSGRIRREGATWAGVGISWYHGKRKLGNAGEKARGTHWWGMYKTFTIPPEADAVTLWFSKAKGPGDALIADLQLQQGAVTPVTDLLLPDNQLTPIAKACAIWSHHAQGPLLATTAPAPLSAYTSMCDAGPVVFILNPTTKAAAATLAATGGTLPERWQISHFTGTSPEDTAPQLSKPQQHSGAALSLPPFSITVLGPARP
ncbi:MAG: hypothetical protein PF961_08055 [Planctomycetota bacterium]|jgi:hypothetical protein|nr:hypothetical protein [Planctomycetota bacterium]